MNLFDPEGKLVGFITKLGELILINLLWLICCIPIVTILPATTSFYYVVIKCIRRERGNPIPEFFKSMKRCLIKGILIELLVILWLAILFAGRAYAYITFGSESFNLLMFVYDFLIGFTALYVLYLIPAFSRFSLKLIKLFKLTFVMLIRYIYLAVILLIIFAGITFLMIRFIPWVLIVLIPGVFVYLWTYFAEPALIKYTPSPEEGEDAWYLPDNK